jgi:hypothetical protein
MYLEIVRVSVLYEIVVQAFLQPKLIDSKESRQSSLEWPPRFFTCETRIGEEGLIKLWGFGKDKPFIVFNVL